MIGPELERRVLAIVLDAMRTNLQTGANHHTAIYNRNNSNFWNAKREDFRRTALEVAAERAGDERLILRVAYYLYHGLGRGGDAIQILLECHARTGLRHAARLKLCEYLVWQKRAAEALPHLSEMITSRPDDAPARRLQMVAFHQVGQKHDLDQAFKNACAWLRENESWKANLIRPLAGTCLDTELYAEAEPLYDELIQLGVKAGQSTGYSRPNLSEDYRHLAEARSQLGRTEEAVDAAAAAIVTWPGGHYRRTQALQVLVRVLGEAKDLDAYMAGLDRRVAESGRDSPIIRKALGQVLAERKLHARAAAQYRRALETAPDDVPTWKTLVSLLDRASHSVEATLALREAASVAARDPGLYRRLGDRYLRVKDAQEAERAFTNMVEIMPHESAGHLQLAEVREKQRRWTDAAHHWREVMRIRTKEPTGYIRLVKVLIRSGKLDEAQPVIETLRRTTWPDRFSNVAKEIRQIEQLMRKATR